MAHAHIWDDFAVAFGDRYHVLALDQRGHGESEWSKDMAYTLDDHFSDIATFIEILGLRDLILVGHSMGGRNALFYAACKSDEVRRLILVDSRPDDTPQASQSLRNMLITFPLHANSLDEVVEAIQSLYPYLSRAFCHHIAHYGYRQLEDQAFVPRYDSRMSLQSERAGYTIEDLSPFMKKISCPTLIVRGKESSFLSRKVAQNMCKQIQNAELREVPKSAHMPAQENPAAFNKVIADFLNT